MNGSFVLVWGGCMNAVLMGSTIVGVMEKRTKTVTDQA